MKLIMNLGFLLLPCAVMAWAPRPLSSSFRISRSTSKLDMAAVGIVFGSSTGNTADVADLIYEAFGDDVAAEPIDVDTLEEGQLASVFGAHSSLVVGTPTWNTGADTERSGTGWDELYYTQIPEIKNVLEGKKCAVFGCGDQVSYAENFADATGELFDVFENSGCVMLGSWSQEGYEHESSKSIRGDKFCGLLLDMVNQEDMTEERVQQWVEQLKSEGILEEGGAAAGASATIIETEVNGHVATPFHQVMEEETKELDDSSSLLDQHIGAHSSGGFTPHYNPTSGRTMWVSADGRKSYVTVDPPTQVQQSLSP